MTHRAALDAWLATADVELADYREKQRAVAGRVFPDSDDPPQGRWYTNRGGTRFYGEPI